MLINILYNMISKKNKIERQKMDNIMLNNYIYEYSIVY